MSTRDAPQDWRRFEVARIPSKASTPHLDRFLAQITARSEGQVTPSALDLGCGDGRLARRLHDMGFSVTGVDVSPTAVRAALSLIPPAPRSDRSLQFHVADMAADEPPCIASAPFDLVVCQLVLSIIGDDRRRRNALRHARNCLRPGGWLYVSASGVSDSINAGYATLYAEDFPHTGEWHTYFSRDSDGTILYATHHFTAEELASLLEEEGFEAIRVTTELEQSSRRPDEAAFFLYATCRKRMATV